LEKLFRILKDDEGQTLVEYALIIGLVSMVLIGALTGISSALQGAFTSIASTLSGIVS
jgi:pilus assembly protein Flp/PilA